MHALDVDHQLERLAPAGRGARVEPGDEARCAFRGTGLELGGRAEIADELLRVVGDDGRSVDREVGEHLRPERFQQVDRCGHATAPATVGGEARVLEVLGSDADHDPATLVPAQRRATVEHAIVELDARRAERHGDAVAVAIERRVDEVHRRRPDEPGHEEVRRTVVEHLRRVDLLQVPLLQHRDAVAHRHRLDLVVGDVDRRDAEVLLQLRDLGAHLHPELRVEVRQRLVHEERLRLAHDRAAHRDPLALAARERLRLAVQVLGQPEDLGGVVHPSGDLVLAHLPELQGERHVVVHGHVRVQGVVLEDHRDVAVLRRQVVHDPVPDAHRAARDLLEPGHHAQRRGLPAPGRPDEHHELAVGDVEVQARDGLGAVGVDLGGAFDRDVGHGVLSSVRRYPVTRSAPSIWGW